MIEYVALLRAIAHVPMRPFREAMEEMGFTDVRSYGMSGNLLFNAEKVEVSTLEQRIAQRLSAVALIRCRGEMQAVVDANPFLGQEGAAVTFLAELPAPASVIELEGVAFEGSPPIIVGRTVYHIFPTRPLGKRTSIDLESILGVVGTARSSRVVSEILTRMSA